MIGGCFASVNFTTLLSIFFLAFQLWFLSEQKAQWNNRVSNAPLKNKQTSKQTQNQNKQKTKKQQQQNPYKFKKFMIKSTKVFYVVLGKYKEAQA